MSLPDRLSSLGSKDDGGSGGGGKKESTEPPDPGSGTSYVQRCVIIQKDERGYGFTVSGDNPVHVASVKTDGAAMRAGVQQGDRIVKVNGTLVTCRNHLDVVKLIKSGSYVALTLLGKPHAGVSAGGGVSSVSSIAGVGSVPGGPPPTANVAHQGGAERQVTAPRPVDPDKDRELWQQKVHMTRAMYETAKEDFDKIQRLYVLRPSEKLHSQLLEKERTAKALENQLKQLTGAIEDSGSSPMSLSNRNSDSEHGGLDHTVVQSWAASVPSGGGGELGGSMSDSPMTSPSVSPTPNDRHNGQDMEDSMISHSSGRDIIINDDEDVHSEDDQVNDPGPFADIHLLDQKPAHMAIFLNYLISNSDPSPVLFHIVSDIYSRTSGNTKELRKWAYEIFSTFISQKAPLSISVEDNVISQVDNILMTSVNRTDSDNMLRSMFNPARDSVQNDIYEHLADFRTRKDLGMGNFFGTEQLEDNMDKASEIKVAEGILIKLIQTLGGMEDNANVTDKDQAISWALATFLRPHVGSKSSSSAILDRVQTFMMKDKKIKFPGSRSSRAKQIRGHQFTLQHFYWSTFCSYCGGLIWGVGYQGYQCQSCEMTLHKQCVEETIDMCGGKQKKRVSKLFPPVISQNRKVSTQSGPPSYNALDQLPRPIPSPDARSPLGGPDSDAGGIPTQPLPRDEASELASIPTEHSVKSIVSRYQELTSPTGPGPGSGLIPATSDTGSNPIDRRGSSDLSRSGSLNNKEGKSDRPTRRAKSDPDVDQDLFKAINQSDSSSASSLSKSSVESPSESTECVVDQYDSDLDVEPTLPPLKAVYGEEVVRKLKPKEKKRQDVINELFHTEKTHLCGLKVIELLFFRPMSGNPGAMRDLALALFPNMDEMIRLHESVVKDMKERSSIADPVVSEVGDILLKRFDGEAGDRFRKGCANYCRNQAYALIGLKKQTAKDTKLFTLLQEAEADPRCRRLQLKDLVPSQMQRLTKYPLLIENLLKYTQANSEEHKRLERALERCKHILAYVNTAVKECENFHKLKELEKKIDRRAVEDSKDPAVEDLKKLKLSDHKLIFDGTLTWKLRSHRTVDVYALLFEDMLLLLQKLDDKYILKCQNASVPSAVSEDKKFTHPPLLKLENLLARSLATDKKSFFVVNISQVKAQMYEFSAATTEMRVRWCNLINNKAEELKNNSRNSVSRSASTVIHSPQHKQIEADKQVRLTRNASTPSKSMPGPEDLVDTVDGLDDYDQDEDSELIHPDEVTVSAAVAIEAAPVRSALDLLRENETSLKVALAERERLVMQILGFPYDHHQNQHLDQDISQQASGDVAWLVCRATPEALEQSSPESLLQRAISMNTHFLQMVNSAEFTVAQQHHLHTEEESTGLLSPHRAMSVVTQGDTSASSEAETASSGSAVSPNVQQAGGPASPTGPVSPAGGASLTVPMPMEQLKAMAQEMNQILSRLMAAMSSGSEERHQLRQDLAEAQQKLDALKEIQRQMTVSGAVPAGRVSPRPTVSSSPPASSGADSHIPSTSSLSMTREKSVEREELQVHVVKEQVVQQHFETQIQVNSSPEAGSHQAIVSEEVEVRGEAEALVSRAGAARDCDSIEATGLGQTLHSGLQEATVDQLEESVMDLSDQGAQLLQAVSTHQGVGDEFGEDPSSHENKMLEVAMLDDDDDNNEVSVADLPLPDIASMGVEEDVGRSLSPMLSAAELEDSDDDSDDNDTLTSRTSQHEHQCLATTIEEDEEEDRRTLRGSVDDNDNDSLRKNSYPSPSPSDGSSKADSSLSPLIRDEGAGGDSLVDPDKPCIDLGSDNTEPIEI